MTRMHKVFIVTTIITVSLFVVAVELTINKMDDANNHMEKHVGDTIVLNGVSLRVLDYSLVNNVYILEDGTEINPKLVENE